MPGGQPTKLTDKLITEIVGYISKGNYIEVSCQACGIDKVTYYDYLKQAEALKDKTGALSEGELRLLEFSNAVKKAHSEAEVELTSELRSKSRDWQNLAWLLERTRNERYGQRQQLDLASKEPIRIVFETVKEGK